MITTLLAAAALAQPITPQQLAQQRTITELAFSPDGCRVAFASDISGAVEVWSVSVCRDAAGAKVLREEPAWPEQLSALNEQATELTFAPDGDGVLFASDRGGDERRDLYVTNVRGGPAEALTLTAASETDPDGVRGASFSPDGRRLAYIADRPSKSTAPAAGAEDGAGFQLFVMDLDTRESRRVTREPVGLRSPVWSPDGRTIAMYRTADGQAGDLLFVDLASGATRVVEPPTDGGSLIAQQFMPDGKDVLCLALNQKGFLQLALVSAAGGRPRLFGPDDWDVDRAVARGGAGIVYSRNEKGRSALYRLASPKAAPVRLFGPEGHVAEFDVDARGRRLAMLWGDSRRPSDVWVMDLASGRRRQMTRSLAAGLDPEELSEAASIEFPSSDGTIIHSFYLPPKRWSLGLPPPVIVAPHGGPDLQTFDEFDPLWQALSQAGFGVLLPNYRGSSGYGADFLDLNNKDWGGKDLDDLWAGVAYLAERGYADVTRAGVTGGSYGGYLTLMALARRPELWAAGVELYGMPDLKLDFELSGERFLEWYKTEMGTPATDPELFKERSAVTYLDAIRAPLLIFQGANDTNVPPAESELIYRKLLERRVPVGLVVYPDEGHGFTRRRNRLDYVKRTVDFFVSKLGASRDAGLAPAGSEPTP
ncbi:MAG: S9 family peptidase [Elusimicrobia bacterium]|nr:S9 family peptidase [Elusimicrobiota bacterium]